jgi:hypothetical protein
MNGSVGERCGWQETVGAAAVDSAYASAASGGSPRPSHPRTEATKMRDTAPIRGPSYASLARRAWGLLGFLLEAQLCDVQLGVAATGMGTIWRRAKRGALANRTSTPSSRLPSLLSRCPAAELEQPWIWRAL